mmetsp:Transcript_34145/g.81239  ORF Transcript_34145/g.81239 Transcript_34145/m.81239 type:complete len:271 (+) Transcript_34145:1522-2334(+)
MTSGDAPRREGAVRSVSLERLSMHWKASRCVFSTGAHSAHWSKFSSVNTARRFQRDRVWSVFERRTAVICTESLWEENSDTRSSKSRGKILVGSVVATARFSPSEAKAGLPKLVFFICSSSFEVGVSGVGVCCSDFRVGATKVGVFIRWRCLASSEGSTGWLFDLFSDLARSFHRSKAIRTVTIAAVSAPVRYVGVGGLGLSKFMSDSLESSLNVTQASPNPGVAAKCAAFAELALLMRARLSLWSSRSCSSRPASLILTERSSPSGMPE